MSKADEMFEKLGYEKIQDNDVFVNFIKGKDKISFCKTYKFFECMERYAGMSISKMISVEELQAINEKVKELGWLNE